MIIKAFCSLVSIQSHLQFTRVEPLLPIKQPEYVDPAFLYLPHPSLPFSEYLKRLLPLGRGHIIFNLLCSIIPNIQHLVIFIKHLIQVGLLLALFCVRHNFLV
jgi:hypothetical protein